MSKILLVLFSVLLLTSCGSKSSQVVQASDRSSRGSTGELSEADQMRLTSMYIDAQRERMLGNSKEAESLLLKCQSIDPENHAVMYDRATLALERQSGPEALELALGASERDPDNKWYTLLLAELYIAKGDYKKAESAYEQVIKNHASAFEYTYDLSMVRYRAGDINGAIDALDDIVKKNGFSEEVFQQKQLLYRESGQTDKAVKELEEKIKENPKDPLYYGMLAELYTAMGENEKAMENYQKILEFDPENGMVQMSLYDHYVKNGEDEKALEALLLGFRDELIDIDSKMGVLLGFYDRSESDLSLRPKAIELCETLIEVYPENPKSHSVYGDFLLREGKLEDARNSFETAVEMEPDNQIIWNQLLYLDSELEDYAAMVRHGSEAVELYPAEPSFYLYTGFAHTNLGEHEEAIEMFETGKEMVFNNDLTLFEFYSNLGSSYHDVGRHAESDKMYDKALKIDPENAFVLNNYSYYLSLRKVKLEKAEGMARKANEVQPGSASFEDTFAWVLFQSAKYPEARIWIEKAIAHGGEASGEVQEHYGDILFKLGEIELAKSAWNLAKDLGGHSDQLLQKIAQGQIIE